MNNREDVTNSTTEDLRRRINEEVKNIGKVEVLELILEFIKGIK